METKPFNIRVQADTLELWKARAIQSGTSVSALIMAAMSDNGATSEPDHEAMAQVVAAKDAEIDHLKLALAASKSRISPRAESAVLKAADAASSGGIPSGLVRSRLASTYQGGHPSGPILPPTVANTEGEAVGYRPKRSWKTDDKR